MSLTSERHPRSGRRKDVLGDIEDAIASALHGRTSRLGIVCQCNSPVARVRVISLPSLSCCHLEMSGHVVSCRMCVVERRTTAGEP